MLAKLAAIREKYLHLQEQMSDPATISDMNRLTKISREYKSLEPLMEAFRASKKRTRASRLPEKCSPKKPMTNSAKWPATKSTSSKTIDKNWRQS